MSILFLQPSVFLVCLSVLFVSLVAYITVFDKCHLIFFYLVQQPPVGQGLLIPEVSRSHTTLGRAPLDK